MFIYRHAAFCHEVELTELVDPLIEQGLIDRAIARESFKSPVAGEQGKAPYTIQVSALKNCDSVKITSHEMIFGD